MCNARVITTTRSVRGLIGLDCDEGKEERGKKSVGGGDQDCETSLRDLGCVA
jgi:hypothetical protein